MSLSNMPTGTVAEPGAREPRGSQAPAVSATDRETGNRVGKPGQRVSELERRVAALETELDRLSDERRDLRDRYELLLQQRAERTESTECTGHTAHTEDREPPAGDSLRLRLARLLGLR